MPHFLNGSTPPAASPAGDDDKSIHARFDKLEQLYVAGIEHLKQVLGAKQEPVEVEPTGPSAAASSVAPSLDAPPV